MFAGMVRVMLEPHSPSRVFQLLGDVMTFFLFSMMIFLNGVFSSPSDFSEGAILLWS